MPVNTKFEIILERAEGPHHLVRKPVILTSFAEANRTLITWAYSAPKLGCDKVDFKIIVDKRENYKGCYCMHRDDIHKWDHIQRHVIRLTNRMINDTKLGPEAKFWNTLMNLILKEGGNI